MFVCAGAEKGWEGRSWLLGWGLGEGSLLSPGAAWPGMDVGSRETPSTKQEGCDGEEGAIVGGVAPRPVPMGAEMGRWVPPV